MKIPSIRIDDETDICVYFCFMLNAFGGELGDCAISEIVISAGAANYFELMSAVGYMEEKKLVSVRNDKERSERVYTLLPQGKVIADELSAKIPLSVREKTTEIGISTLERIKREKELLCYVNYDYLKKRYDLVVKFLNEVNGDIILEVKLYAPDEKSALEMKERFLSKSSQIITRTMNMFLKDDFFMFD